MSVDKINEKVDAFFASNSGDADKVLDELKSQLPNDYDGKENKDILNAEKLSMNFSDKKLAKGRDKDAKEIAHNQQANNDSLSNKKLSKNQRALQFFGSLANGLFGSNKKQEEELRRLESDVKRLNEQHLSLSSDIAETISNINAVPLDLDSDLQRSSSILKENEQIDAQSKLNMKKAEKSARISELRKKGVK